MFCRAGPAGFGDVDDHAVPRAVFELGVDVRRFVPAQAQGIVDIIANRRTHLCRTHDRLTAMGGKKSALAEQSLWA